LYLSSIKLLRHNKMEQHIPIPVFFPSVSIPIRIRNRYNVKVLVSS
jgi:hypothetical protein